LEAKPILSTSNNQADKALYDGLNTSAKELERQQNKMLEEINSTQPAVDSKGLGS
jgi:hypothetical protein